MVSELPNSVYFIWGLGCKKDFKANFYILFIECYMSFTPTLEMTNHAPDDNTGNMITMCSL